MSRTVARMLIGGRGRGFIFIYLCFARQISFEIDQFEFDLKKNSSVRTQIYENTLPPLNQRSSDGPENKPCQKIFLL